MEGMTIHAWGAVTPGSSNMDMLISCIKTCKPALKRWRNTQVLVIDEGINYVIYYVSFKGTDVVLLRLIVSMVDGHLFDTIAAIPASWAMRMGMTSL